MPLLGAHMSIAGGYYKAVEAAVALGMETVQIFTKNNNQWQGKPLTTDDVRLFRDALDRSGLQHPCAHNSYLINVGSSDEALWQRSVDALVDEVQRAERLGLDGVVMHPGAAVGSTPEEALARIAQGIDETHKQTPGVRTQLWLEATAGQGSCLGCQFEHLAWILDHVHEPERLGVCVDTCHIFAAGYPIGTKTEFDATFRQFDRLVGLDRIRAFHVNDSKKPLGSRVDRHEHIGEGCLGLEPFRLLLNDKRFARLPMYLETKKEQRGGEEMDAVNLRVLRSLIGVAAPIPANTPAPVESAKPETNEKPRKNSVQRDPEKAERQTGEVPVTTGPERLAWQWMALLMLLATGARAAACMAFPANLSDDRDVYLAIAQGVADGRGFSSPGTTTPTAFRPPLYPLLLAPVSGVDEALGRAALHGLLGAVMTAAVAWLASLSGVGVRRQFAAGLLVAVDPLLVYYASLPMTETLASCLSALLLLSGAAACKASSLRRRTFWSSLSALLFGLCVLTRPTYWAFAGCVSLFGLWQFLRGTRESEQRYPPRAVDWLLGGILCMAVVAPWVIRNWQVMGRPILTTTHGGYTILLGNNDAYYREVISQPWGTIWDGSHGPGQQAWAHDIVTRLESAGLQGELVWDAWMKQEAWKTIRQEPRLFLQACLRRFASFWGLRPHADSASTVGRFLSLASAIYYGVLWLLLAGGIVAALRSGGCAVELCLLLVASFVVVHLIYWTDARCGRRWFPRSRFSLSSGGHAGSLPRQIAEPAICGATPDEGNDPGRQRDCRPEDRTQQSANQTCASVRRPIRRVSQMIVGLPKEIKTDEYRVAMIPSGVEELTRAKHTVIVQEGAGVGSESPMPSTSAPERESFRRRPRCSDRQI